MNNLKNKFNHLFICATPLQLFIAIRIQESIGILDNQCSYLYWGDANQTQASHIIKKLISTDSQVFIINRAHEKSLKNAYNLLSKNTPIPQNFHSVYTSNIGSDINMILLSKIKFNHFYSFDDGINNINTKSYQYSWHNLNIRQRIQYFYKYQIKYRLKYGITMHPLKKLKLIKQHFSIFPTDTNIISRIFPIKLINDFQHVNKKKNKNISILIGACFKDIFDLQKNNSIFNELEVFFKKTKINYYLKHPREYQFKNIPNKKLHTLAEQYILSLIQEGYDIELYGFCGTTQLFFKDCPQVHNTLLYHEYLTDTIKQSYKLPAVSKFKIENL